MCLEKWIKELIELYENGYYFWDALKVIKRRMEDEEIETMDT